MLREVRDDYHGNGLALAFRPIAPGVRPSGIRIPARFCITMAFGGASTMSRKRRSLSVPASIRNCPAFSEIPFGITDSSRDLRRSYLTLFRRRSLLFEIGVLSSQSTGAI